LQLDPTTSLSAQLKAIPGDKMECFVAAAFASVGYTVFRNLFIELGGERVAETDGFASVFTPLRESRVMVECKGGHPKFDEIRKFASLNALLNPPPDELLIISRPGCPPNRIELANLLRVRIVERTNLTYYVLPLVGGQALRQERASSLNRYLAWQTVHEYLTSHVGKHHQIRAHYRCLEPVMNIRIW
jgi:predicted RecB family endonuclease